MKTTSNAKRARRCGSRTTHHVPRGAACLSILFVHFQLTAAVIDTNQLPPAAAVQIDFARDVQPIFEQSCIRCHGPERPKSHFRLNNRESALKGGNENNDDIVPGDSAHSRLIHYVTRLVADMEMPPQEKGEPLTPEQIGVLRAWIDQGASWGNVAPTKLEFSITQTLRWISVSGDKGKFREIEGVKEGWGGGVQQFSMLERIAPDKTFSAEGRALPVDNDYRVQLELRKTDFGFVRGGFETWRKYYDDNGVFAPAFPANFYSLNRDLHLDRGRAWIDFGLTLPDKPQIVLGYEYQFKRGNEATLQQGPVGTLPPYDPNTDAKNIYPASKHIDEDVHILKADFSYEFRGWQLADSARAEFYNLRTHRTDVLQDTFGPTPDFLTRVSERDEHTQGMNTLSASKQIKDWWFVSGAYYYSQLEGGASLQQNTLDGSGAPAFGNQWFVRDITFERETHAGSLSTLAGPWSGLTLSLGVQGEWTRQKSAGFENLQSGDPASPPLFSAPSTILGKLDSSSARENIGLRYTKIPYTVLFAEARLRQECLGRFEQRPDNSVAFIRDTQANIEKEEYRVGFNTSPWSRVSLNASFRHSAEQTDYTRLQVFSAVGYAYPGFMLWRNIEDNQVEARLVWRVTSWLRTSLNYRFQQTDFNSATAGIPAVTTGGSINAAQQLAHVYSFNAGFTPFSRLYLSSTFSYSDSRTATAQNGADYLVPYAGNIYSMLTSATFALDPKTDFNLAYSFSRSDYGQGNKTTGLPAGIDFERHQLQAGINHRFTKNVVGSLAYNFAQYREPTSGGANDFTAHGVFATVTLAWR